MSSPNPLICPLCGRPNRCGQADPAQRDQPCWCFTTEIDRQALQRIPPEAIDRSCLCPACAQGIATSAAEHQG